MDITQGNLVMGFRTGVTAADPDYPAMVLLNTVFGGGITSKLFTHVRERLSLCYYASSGLNKFKGIMTVSSGVDMDKYVMARDEILRQLDLCRAGDITSEELESARSALLSSLRASEDSLSLMVDSALSQEIGKYDYTPEDLAQALTQVTVEDVQQAAKKVQLDTIFFLKGAE
jgi:predicted Zn-dependent peptidase